jgi:hypothetical protein
MLFSLDRRSLKMVVTFNVDSFVLCRVGGVN